MNRRRFLSTASASIVLAGCSRKPTKPGTVGGSSTLVEAQAIARREHVQVMQAAKLPTTTTFTTARPTIDVVAHIPELKGLIKQTHRLQPFSSDEPKADESKLGGQFLWPADEAWPTVPDTDAPLAGVLQLRQEDAPPQVAFWPGANLVQIFWNPRFGDRAPRTELFPVVVWRKRADISADLLADPFAEIALGNAESKSGVWTDYVPYPCRLAPSRVLELPSWDVLPDRMKQTVIEKLPGGEVAYREQLSVSEGSKVGGYAPKQPDAKPPACPKCQWGMDYFQTIAEQEYITPRWQPEGMKVPNASGLKLGPSAAVHIFLCRRCEDWPAAAVG